MNTTIIVFATVLCLSLTAESPASVLVENGRPKAVVVISKTAPDSVQYAADELRSYVEKVSGAELPIQTYPENGVVNIYVGESDHTRKLGLTTAGLKSDGFKIETGNGWIAILGRDYSGPPISGLRNPWRLVEVYNDKLKLGAFGEAGTLYGVYRFLEDACSIRWYMPGDIGTVIPRSDTVKVGSIHLAVSPDFEYRYPWFCNFADSETDARWFRRAGFGAAYPAQCIDSFAMFLKHKDEHPEYFALIDGKRDFTNLSCIAGGGNLCLSNPGVAEQWIKDIDEYFDKNPSQFIFPLAPNDGMVKICECPDCQKQTDLDQGESGKFSNYVWTFIDKVARGVAKKHPDKFVGGIAYENYKSPPTRLPKLSPNVAVMICQSRNSFGDKKQLAEAKNAVAGWHSRTSHLYLWEYYLNSWPPMRGFPVFFPHILSQDLKGLKGVGRGEFIEAESNAGGTNKLDCPGMMHLNLYLTARLLWDADQDVDKLLEDYYTLFYGPARADMKEFWTLAERIWTARGSSGNPINIYTRDDLSRLSACLDRAETATKEGSEYRARVEIIKNEFVPARRKVSNPLVTNPPKLALKQWEAPIQVDGLLNEEAWKSFEPFEFVNNDGEDAQYKTFGYAGWDNRYLNLAFLNYESEMNKLTVKATKRDQDYAPGMWEDDSMEVFVVPDPSNRDSYLQFIVNANGVAWDARVAGKGSPADLKWNSGIQTSARREPNRWVLEMRIPLSDIGFTSSPAGKTILVNFYRNRYCGGPVVYSCWSPTLTIQHANPERFGSIEFLAK